MNNKAVPTKIPMQSSRALYVPPALRRKTAHDSQSSHTRSPHSQAPLSYTITSATLGGAKLHAMYDTFSEASAAFFAKDSCAYSFRVNYGTAPHRRPMYTLWVRLVPGDSYWPENCTETKSLAVISPSLYAKHTHCLQCQRHWPYCATCEEFQSVGYMVLVEIVGGIRMAKRVMSCDEFVAYYSRAPRESLPDIAKMWELAASATTTARASTEETAQAETASSTTTMMATTLSPIEETMDMFAEEMAFTAESIIA